MGRPANVDRPKAAAGGEGSPKVSWNHEIGLLVGFRGGFKACKAVKEELKEGGNGGRGRCRDDAVGRFGVPDRPVVVILLGVAVVVVACGKGRKFDAGGGCCSSKDDAKSRKHRADRLEH